MAKKPKADQRADTRGKPWAGIPHAVLDSLAYLHCDLWERAILIEIVRVFNGYNNGEIGLSVREIAMRLRNSNFGRICLSLASLMEKGLIDVSVEAPWKARLARQYRLTFASTGKGGRHIPATNDYKNWSPKKFGAEPVSAERRKSADASSTAAQFAAEPSSAAPYGNSREMPGASAEPVSALIDKPYLTRPNGTSGWWTADSRIQLGLAALDWLKLTAGVCAARGSATRCPRHLH